MLKILQNICEFLVHWTLAGQASLCEPKTLILFFETFFETFSYVVISRDISGDISWKLVAAFYQQILLEILLKLKQFFWIKRSVPNCNWPFSSRTSCALVSQWFMHFRMWGNIFAHLLFLTTTSSLENFQFFPLLKRPLVTFSKSIKRWFFYWSELFFEDAHS